jgi:hypothetical protein
MSKQQPLNGLELMELTSKIATRITDSHLTSITPADHAIIMVQVKEELDKFIILPKHPGSHLFILEKPNNG